MPINITITPAMFLAIQALVKSGIELIGTFTEDQLIKMANDEELRSQRLQKRQEEG